MPAKPLTSGRRVQQRVINNDARLLDAAVAVLATGGWSEFTYLTVARTAGLSRRSLQNRYPALGTLAAAVWQERCAIPLKEMLKLSMEAAGTSPEKLTQHLTTPQNPEPTLAAAAELLTMSQFVLPLRQAVATTTGAFVRSLCDPEETGSVVVAAKSAFISSLALGLLFAARTTNNNDVNLESQIRPLFSALTKDHLPSPLPKQQARHLDRDPDFATGDAITDALLQSMLDNVASNGFEGSSVDRIASAAGVTTGALFARYPNKLALFIDATGRQQALAMPATQKYMTTADATHVAGIGMAMNIRESQRPTRAHLRAVGLEQIRMSWHVDELRAIRQRQISDFVSSYINVKPDADRDDILAMIHVGVALGIGISVLPLVDPDCWTLPYDVVTIPLAQIEGA